MLLSTQPPTCNRTPSPFQEYATNHRRPPKLASPAPNRQPPQPPPPPQDAINRQNAAFAVGMVAHTCPAQAAPHVQQLLQALHPLFREEEEAGPRDNAAGAVGRMLLAMGGALPVEQIAPVLAGALPLQVSSGGCVIRTRQQPAAFCS